MTTERNTSPGVDEALEQLLDIAESCAEEDFETEVLQVLENLYQRTYDAAYDFGHRQGRLGM